MCDWTCALGCFSLHLMRSLRGCLLSGDGSARRRRTCADPRLLCAAGMLAAAGGMALSPHRLTVSAVSGPRLCPHALEGEALHRKAEFGDCEQGHAAVQRGEAAVQLRCCARSSMHQRDRIQLASGVRVWHPAAGLCRSGPSLIG